MPRIYDSASNPVDYCRDHFPKTEAEARRLHGNKGDGPDGRGNCFGYDDEHPPYAETDYRCHKCRRRLGDEDDYLPSEPVPRRPWPLKPVSRW